MKRCTYLLSTLALVVLLPTLAAHAGKPKRLLFKGELIGEPAGNVSLVFNLYDSQGGLQLFQTEQVVQVREEGLFSVFFDVPAEMPRPDTIWVEFARGSAPNQTIGNGPLFVRPIRPDQRQPADTAFTGACVLCYTCGGSWPYYGGITARGSVAELPAHCEGEDRIIDDDPELCCAY